jgi:hypothetical protein
MEIDPDPASQAPRALTPYELASRLSYLLWSSMPDDRLFALAADGTLVRDDVLRGEVDRMIDDPRSEGFVEGFGGAWLGESEALSRQIDPAIIPPSPFPWDAVRTAMGKELLLYFAEFLHSDRSFATVLDADFNFVNAALATHYGLPTSGLADALTRVENTTDRRKGLLGLGATFLAMSTGVSTSPFHRGEWILERMLCQPDPGFGGTLDSISGAPSSTFHARVAAISDDPTCAQCHAAPDGLGLGLEEVDPTGAFRTNYPDGPVVDSSGTALDGTRFVGEAALADLLAREPRFLGCAARQALRYALNRELGPDDDARLARLQATWTSGVPTLRALLEEVVLDGAFRARQGEGAP